MAKTLKVRIPAVVSPDGKWAAYGYPMTDPSWSMIEEVADNGDYGDYERSYQRFWITAELPVPEPQEVAGDVVAAR